MCWVRVDSLFCFLDRVWTNAVFVEVLVVLVVVLVEVLVELVVVLVEVLVVLVVVFVEVLLVVEVLPPSEVAANLQ